MKRPILYYYNDIKKLLFGVLQNREYNFGERMVVLGIAMKKKFLIWKKMDK